MQINWHGLACFRLLTKEASVVIDPFDASVGLKPPHFSSDLLLMTSDRPGHSNAAAVSGQSFRIDGPGEFEVKGVFVWGHGVDNPNDGQRRTTVYVLEAEDITLAHLGDLNVVLNESQLDRLEGVDVLLIPVGGHGVLDSKKAVELISEIEPRIVIPMYYHQPGLKAALDPVAKFAKEMGVKETEPVDKIRLVKRELPQEETKVIILKP